jgi:hypothetical protein
MHEVDGSNARDNNDLDLDDDAHRHGCIFVLIGQEGNQQYGIGHFLNLKVPTSRSKRSEQFIDYSKSIIITLYEYIVAMKEKIKKKENLAKEKTRKKAKMLSKKEKLV